MTKKSISLDLFDFDHISCLVPTPGRKARATALSHFLLCPYLVNLSSSADMALRLRGRSCCRPSQGSILSRIWNHRNL